MQRTWWSEAGTTIVTGPNWDISSSPGMVFHQVYPGYVGFLRIYPCPCRIVVMFHPCPCKVLTFVSCTHRFGAVQPLHMQGSYDLTLTHAFLCHLTIVHAGLLWCFTFAHAGFLQFNLCPCRAFVPFGPRPCRALWLNPSPCSVLCCLTLAHAGFLWFNPCPCRVVVMFHPCARRISMISPLHMQGFCAI